MSPTKVLVVDDDADIQRIVKDNLELDGFAVLVASTGKDALSVLDRNEPDLVILDIMLPDMDGVQICRFIRKQSHVPVIMLTAKDAVSDKVLCLESGADDYVVKPFDYLELAARINACLRRGKGPLPPEQVLEAGDLRIDPNARSVEVRGKEVVLTRKEFDLLALLVSHTGRVLDRESIKKALWSDTKLYRWSRAIDVHVQHLRAKLETEGKQPGLIVTVAGVGYMFSPPSEGG